MKGDGTFRSVIKGGRGHHDVIVETTFSRNLRQTKAGGWETRDIISTRYRDAVTGRMVKGSVLDEMGIKRGAPHMASSAAQVTESLFVRAQEAEAGHITGAQFERLKHTVTAARLATPEKFVASAQKMFARMNPSDSELAEFSDKLRRLTPEQAQHWYERNQNLINETFEAYHNHFTQSDKLIVEGSKTARKRGKGEVGVRDDVRISGKRKELLTSLDDFQARYL